MVTADAIRLSPEHAESANKLATFARDRSPCDGDFSRNLFFDYLDHVAGVAEARLACRARRTGADEIRAVEAVTADLIARPEQSVVLRRTLATGRP